MNVILKSLYLYSLCLWVGSMFFFTAVGAPLAFKALPKEDAGKYTGSVFPKYFGLGYIFGLVSLTSFYTLTKGVLSITSSLVLLLLLVMNILNAVNGLVVTPKASLLKAEFYRKKEDSYYNRFLKLHGISMALNAVTLTLGLMVIGVTSLYLSL